MGGSLGRLDQELPQRDIDVDIVETADQGEGFGRARRVKEWRGVTAKGLVYSASGEPASERIEKVELALVGVGNKS